MKKVQAYMYLFTPFVNQKKSIDIYSAFYSFDKTFQLLHADITDICFLSEFTMDQKYYLSINSQFFLSLKHMLQNCGKPNASEQKIIDFNYI